MKVFHPHSHALHAPGWYLADGTTRPCPEVPARVDSLLETLGAAKLHELIAVPPIENRKSKIENSLFRALEGIHSPAYLQYLRSIHAVSREFQTDVLPDTFPRVRFANPPTKPAAQAGYYCFDLAAPITAGTWAAALNSGLAAVAAADAIFEGDAAAYALCRPPGHHAGPDYCGGFCYINNVAAAAQHLLNAGRKKIAILDLDYHHGNGTQDIFYRRSDVLFISLHADPNTQYPYFWGYAEEIGAADGAGFTLNLPLARNAATGLWFETLEIALTRTQDYHPDCLLVSLGTDVHEEDPVGDFHLNVQDFAKIAHALRGLNLPILFVQEGGYNLRTIGPCVAAALNAFGP